MKYLLVAALVVFCLSPALFAQDRGSSSRGRGDRPAGEGDGRGEKRGQRQRGGPPSRGQRGGRGGNDFGSLKVGDQVPDIAAFDADGKKLELRKALRGHYSVVIFGCLFGGLLPFVLRALKFDPAVCSTPLVMTLVDVTGLIIYMLIAGAILGFPLG